MAVGVSPRLPAPGGRRVSRSSPASATPMLSSDSIARSQSVGPLIGVPKAHGLEDRLRTGIPVELVGLGARLQHPEEAAPEAVSERELADEIRFEFPDLLVIVNTTVAPVPRVVVAPIEVRPAHFSGNHWVFGPYHGGREVPSLLTLDVCDHLLDGRVFVPSAPLVVVRDADDVERIPERGEV